MRRVMLDDTGRDLIEKHRLWWERRSTLITRVQGSPLGDLWLPLASGQTATDDMTITPGDIDFERAVGPPLHPGPFETEGQRFRTVTAFGRTPWVEAILGTPIRATIQGGSMRTRAIIESWDDWSGVAAHRDDDWLALLLRMTEALVERSGGRRAVVAPIMRGPSDLAEAVLGAELQCYSMYDHPRELRAFLEEATELFIEVLHDLLEKLPVIKGGYVSPFGIWAPGTVVRTQCDASAFLSPKHYAEWFLPFDIRISDSTDYSIIHLHSCSLHTVDALLAAEKPQAIQVTLEAEPSGPPLEAMLGTFRQILSVKPLLLEGRLTEDELDWLLDQLPHGGLAITAQNQPF
jgi:hypothetical protein